MSLSDKLDTLSRCVKNLWRSPRETLRRWAAIYEPVREPVLERGADVARRWPSNPAVDQILETNAARQAQEDAANPLRTYFEGVKDGPGIWKWLHYFEIYHRHLQKFIGRPVTIVEIGVYSGGSMPMWRNYFGPESRIHGVDIQEACKVYENSHTTIHIGDQADRGFWKRFREAVPVVDVLIDDGGHLPEQQIVTLEEMLPHLRPGGVFICEDIQCVRNSFARFVAGLADEFNAFEHAVPGEIVSIPTPFQAAVHSLHLYPYTLVIEKRDAAVKTLTCQKRGTRWQPFFE